MDVRGTSLVERQQDGVQAHREVIAEPSGAEVAEAPIRETPRMGGFVMSGSQLQLLLRRPVKRASRLGGRG
jgi:hypothetical protein